jgi:hypothetical protein
VRIEKGTKNYSDLLIDKFEEKMLAESLGGALWGWLSLFIPALNPF